MPARTVPARTVPAASTRAARTVILATAVALLPVVLLACDALAVPSPTPAATVAPSPTSAFPSFVRPTPTPVPPFVAHVVARGESLTTIARRYSTTPRSIAFWNRDRYPSLDPLSTGYRPNTIQPGWVLLVRPGVIFDETDLEGSPPPSAVPSAVPSGAIGPSPS
jgi:hypothetical protein